MNFFSLREKLEAFRYACTPGEKLLSGAKLVGSAVANTAIAAGKVTAALGKEAKEQTEKMRNK